MTQPAATLFSVMDSPVGALLLTGNGQALTSLRMNSHTWPDLTGQDYRQDDDAFRDVRQQLEAYFAGELTRFDLPLDGAGTAFQHIVWQALTAIPYGTTETYSELARRIGNDKAARAVGLANGRNPICIIVPCHRVVGAGGALTGYSGGLERKQWLLAHEQGRRPAPLPPERQSD